MSQQASGIINLDTVEVKVEIKSKKKPCFKLIVAGYSRRFKFRCFSAEDLYVWVAVLQTNIEKSLGFKNSLTFAQPPGKIKPWRFDSLSEYQFREIADIGDILLFRGNFLGAKITRSWTKSHFDHVAMVLKFDSDLGEIYFLESNSTQGVTINKWSDFKTYATKVYDCVCIRHLYGTRTDSMMDKLDEYLRTVVGNEYGLRLRKIMKHRNTNPGTTLEQRKFFCSELVAKAYKIMGLLKSDLSSTNYLPQSFSQSGGLLENLEYGARLGEEMMIVS